MALLDDLIACFPKNKKKTPSGWYSFACVACPHKGKSADSLKRGGIIYSNNSVTYNCFRCHTKAHWEQGQPLSNQFQKLLTWCGIDDTEIGRLTMIAFAQTTAQARDLIINDYKPKQIFKPIKVPGKPILEWFNDHLDDKLRANLDSCLEYVADRNLLHQIDRIWWSPEKNFKERIIIPFGWKTINVGYSARSIKTIKYGKYITDSQPGYVFGLDQQPYNARFCIVCEGLLDALSLDALSPLNNSCSKDQLAAIDGLKREVILVPDRDKAGVDLIKTAIENNWSVAFPEWEPGTKDINDAVRKYGTLFTMRSIIESKCSSKLKIELFTRNWCKIKLEN